MARLEWYTTEVADNYTAHTKFLKCNVVAHLYKDNGWHLQIKRRDEVWFIHHLNAKNVRDAMSQSSRIVESCEAAEPKVLKGWAKLSTGYAMLIDIAGILIEAQLMQKSDDCKPFYELRPVGRVNPIRRQTFVDEGLTLPEALKHASLDVNKYLNMFIPYEERHDFVTA